MLHQIAQQKLDFDIRAMTRGILGMDPYGAVTFEGSLRALIAAGLLAGQVEDRAFPEADEDMDALGKLNSEEVAEQLEAATIQAAMFNHSLPDTLSPEDRIAANFVATFDLVENVLESVRSAANRTRVRLKAQN